MDNYNDDIRIIGPSKNEYTIARDPAHSQQEQAVNTMLYTNAAIITSIIQAEGTGMYTVAALPTLVGSQDAAAGWQMIVVYRRSNELLRNLNVWCSFENVTLGSELVVVPVDNFITPTQSKTGARLILAAGGGNPNLVGEYLQFGLDYNVPASMHTLSGPNNKADAFFASQINGNDGTLDTTGTFGLANTVPPNQAATGNRNSWDITNIDFSSALIDNQTSGYLTLSTTNDSYQLAAIGIQIDMNQASFDPIIKTADKRTAEPGETITYTLTFKNTGDVQADSVVVIDDLPDGVSFVPGSVVFNGVSMPSADPTTGIPLGDIPPSQSADFTLSFQAVVTGAAPGTVASNTAHISYSFVPGEGLDPIDSDQTSNQVDIPIVDKARCQAITDLIESVALEQAALSHILNAEGEKLQAYLGLSNQTPESLKKINNSVKKMVDSITQLEMVLQTKIGLTQK